MKAETPIKKWAEDMSAMNQKKKKKIQMANNIL